MVALLYAGVEVNPIVERIAKAIKPEKLTILIDTVLDYMTDDVIQIYPTLLSVLKSVIDPSLEIPCNITNFLRKLNYLDFELSDFDLIFSLLISLGMERKKSFKSVIDDIREKLKIQIPIIPLTERSHQIEITLETGEGRKPCAPFEYYKGILKGEIADIFFGSLNEINVHEEAKKVILKNNVLIICQPDPLTLFALLNNPNIQKLLEEYSGKIVAISQSHLSKPQKKIMEALEQSPGIFGLINMYLNLVDVLILDEKDTEIIVKAGAQDLGMEIVPIDLDISDEEKHSKILKKILKVAGITEEEIISQPLSATNKIKQSISTTTETIKTG
ncbi:MAG: hypothetical protein ACTSQY_07690, partial [Candidatus Odinarchaeia archaeon]